MGKIAKKARSVKGSKAPKKPPRYTIRKDSRNRRYAIDKRTGKRVSVSKAEKEQKARKKAAQVFHGIKPKASKKAAPKAKKTAKTSRQAPPQVKQPKVSRSAAAKKGWETRRAKAKVPSEKLPSRPGFTPFVEGGRATPFATIFGKQFGRPEGPRMVLQGGIVDRATKYPKVQHAASEAWIRNQVDFFKRYDAIERGETPEPFIAPKFDAKHGDGAADKIRFEYFSRAEDVGDIDDIIEHIVDEDDDYDDRELYTLYFSPDVA